ncbi:MAG: transcription-repair coupling factor, partial [Prolixibacteraceae bacterium]|nr:transcription-repair coupling factor [Prolixibacteraceae bacterium]
MEPVSILKYFAGHHIFEDVVKILGDPPGKKIYLKGVVGSNKAIWTANIYDKLRRNMVIILNDREEAAYLFDDLSNLGYGGSTLFFPSSYKRSVQYGQPEQENIVQRTEVLNRVIDDESPVLIISYPEALVENVISKSVLENNTLQISTGDKISTGFLNEFLSEYNFERVEFVYSPGQFSIRGSIVDVFS